MGNGSTLLYRETHSLSLLPLKSMASLITIVILMYIQSY